LLLPTVVRRCLRLTFDLDFTRENGALKNIVRFADEYS
jgi:hypothetical protein